MRSVWVIGFPNGKRCRVFLKWSTKAKSPAVSLTWRSPSYKSCFLPAWKGAEAPLSSSSALCKRCWEESPIRKKKWERGQIRLETKWKKTTEVYYTSPGPCLSNWWWSRENCCRDKERGDCRGITDLLGFGGWIRTLKKHFFWERGS